jgi:geranylgeranyl diphosphate synthase type I
MIVWNKILKHADFVRDAINSTIAEAGEDMSKINRWGADIITRMTSYLFNGKFLRGGLVCMTEEIYAGACGPDSAVIGAAMELIHSGLLIHDDIMDRDALRRGKPSIHEQYSMLAREESIVCDVHFGDSMGICAADVAFFMAYGALSGISQKYTGDIIRACSREYIYVGLGQMQDLYFGCINSAAAEDRIIDLYRYKTARYTFSLPVLCGGILSEVTEDERMRLCELGEILGIIFQIKDDELGLFGDSSLGKPLGSDISSRKMTFFYNSLLKRADKNALKKLSKIFGKVPVENDDMEFVRECIVNTGTHEYVRGIMKEYALSAQKTIEALTMPEHGKETFRDLVEFSLDRTV